MVSLEAFLSWVALVVASGITILTIYTASLIIYRVFFHPLSSYPGPFLAKITDLYTLYHCWTGNRHIDFLNQHTKYGPVFRYGPNRLSFNTHTALHTIHSGKANVRKSDFYHGFNPPSGPNLLGSISKDVHSRKRGVLAFAFSERAIKSMEQYVLANTRILCEKLGSTSEPLNMAKWCTYFAGDVLGEFAFGKSFYALTSPENRAHLEVIGTSGKFMQVSGAAYQLRNTPIPYLFFRPLLTTMKRYRAFATACAIERTQTINSNHKDFYHYLMEATSTDEKISLQETWVESNTLIGAGSDTTSLVLAATFHYLTRNPSFLLKLQAEIRSTFGGQDIEAIRSGPHLSACKYLRACLNETMRMTPPTPGMLPRTVLPGGITIDGYLIPASVEVGTPHYALFHNPLYFRDSFTYRPERWLLDDGASEEEKRELEVCGKAFAPFGLGPRGCIGKSMAVLEMMVVMARVVFRFDFDGVGVGMSNGDGEGRGGMGKERGEYVVKDHFVCGKDGPWISFTPVSVDGPKVWK